MVSISWAGLNQEDDQCGKTSSFIKNNYGCCVIFFLMVSISWAELNEEDDQSVKKSSVIKKKIIVV